MANPPKHSNSAPHSANTSADEEKKIAKEMSPFIIYAMIPILIIVFIALKYGPSY